MVIDTKAIARKVALELCEMPSCSSPPKGVDSASLVFPCYRPTGSNGQQRTRVSEAEARILSCLTLDKLKLPFAVEVPTLQRYTFTGKTEMSARTDLVVYSPRSDAPPKLVRSLAIEFKAHNPRVEAIRKELEKLLREQCDALWFHLLRNADSKTVPALMEKFTRAIGGLRDLWNKCTHTLALSVAILEKKFWLYRTLVPTHDPTPDLSIDYVVRRQEIAIRDTRGWDYEDYEDFEDLKPKASSSSPSDHAIGREGEP